MPKFFVSSDIHGFFDEWMNSLYAAGWDISNPNHYIIVCGDLFDRGRQPQEVLDFCLNTPRVILIRGNHEDLLEECCYRGYPEPHDESNGTHTTINLLGCENDWSTPFDIRCQKTIEKIKPLNQKTRLYFETENYIFVHGWIPVIVRDNLPYYYARNRNFEYYDNWRNANSNDWYMARWINGIDAAYYHGIIEPGKTIVCGHWHCSHGHALKTGWQEFGITANFDPYYDNGIIAIDACTAYSNKVNVVVIEDEFLDDEGEIE